MGPGILDAEQLLRANLPSKSELARGWPVKEHTLSSSAIAGIFKGLGFLFGSSAVASAAAATGTPAPTAQELAARYGTEITQLLLDRPALLKQFTDSGLLAADQADGTPAVAAAVASGRPIAVDQTKQALEALRKLASPSLASILPQ
jgi:hypothetical protein